MRSTCLRSFAKAVAFLAVLAAGTGHAETPPERPVVPPRSAGGQTLEVPEAHLDLGQIFYLAPGSDSQVSLTSRAPLRRIAAVSSRAVGYVAAPFDFDDAERPVLAGAIRLPVASLRIGSGPTENWLREPDRLDAGAHPEIAVVLTDCREVRRVADGGEDDSGFFVYEIELLGRLEARGASVPLAVPAKVSFAFGTGRTFVRMRGDVMILESRFEIDLASLGVPSPEPAEVDLLADTLEVELFLYFSTVSPDKTFDPGYTPEQYQGELRFVTLLRDLDDPGAAYVHGRAHARQKIWGDAGKLLRLVGIVLEDPDVRHRDLGFALELVRRADELTGSADPRILATVAKTYFAMGDPQKAEEWQVKAIRRLPADHASATAAALRADLARYRERRRSLGVLQI